MGLDWKLRNTHIYTQGLAQSHPVSLSRCLVPLRLAVQTNHLNAPLSASLVPIPIPRQPVKHSRARYAGAPTRPSSTA
ncbi:hypothetical protein BDV98DRAFT_570351 [Pterulicium gracile]|uniref:Uncharacterized protein n=1 Tax=Pterulicium gracile TaxID=1884261 RepID=A0A5C3QFF1_9AGAR|nr:hypothetical protein BDV98DRAFT_570351 [Pterula gracilis]